MNKGYITVSTVFVVIFIGLSVTIALRPLLYNQNMLLEHIRNMQEHYNKEAAIVRTLVKLRNNISHSITYTFTDIGITTAIEEISAVNQQVEIIGTTEHNIEIFNSTEITINGTFNLYNPQGILIHSGAGPFSYNVIGPNIGNGYGSYRVVGQYDVRFLRTMERIVRIHGRLFRIVNGNGSNVVEGI